MLIFCLAAIAVILFLLYFAVKTARLPDNVIGYADSMTEIQLRNDLVFDITSLTAAGGIAAVAAAVLRCDPILVTGKGAGLSEEGLLRKQQLIAEAIRSYDLYAADPFTVLSTVGGFDIAGLVGMCVGGALFHLPIVLDGVISMVAALVAERLFPGTKEYLLPSHKGKEPAVELLMKELQMEPVIDGKMALGEGTGAVMLFALLDMALQLYETGTTFSGMQISAYKRFT